MKKQEGPKKHMIEIFQFESCFLDPSRFIRRGEGEKEGKKPERNIQEGIKSTPRFGKYVRRIFSVGIPTESIPSGQFDPSGDLF